MQVWRVWALCFGLNFSFADKADLAPHTANDRFRQSTHAAKNTMG